jgi:DNA polymerase-3 subunit epsilon
LKIKKKLGTLPTMKRRPIYYDTETTGVRAGKDRIVELAAYDPILDKTFCEFINPGCPIPAEVTAITHITDEMVKDALPFKDVAQGFVEFCSGDVVLIAHNNDNFDKPFLEAEFGWASMPFPNWTFSSSYEKLMESKPIKRTEL